MRRRIHAKPHVGMRRRIYTEQHAGMTQERQLGGG
jgi:hypothetical protein